MYGLSSERYNVPDKTYFVLCTVGQSFRDGVSKFKKKQQNFKEIWFKNYVVSTH